MLYWLWRLFEVTLYCHVEGQKNYPIVFGQLTNKDGSMLVGREPEPDFKWENLRGKHVLAGRPGGVPAMMLQYICNSAGLTDSDVNLDTSVEFNAMVGTFDADKQYDYCTMFEPTASDYQKAGNGYIVASVGEKSGAIPYTCFMANGSYIEKNPDKIEGLLRAITKAIKYMNETDSATVAEKLLKYFETSNLDSVKTSLENYKSIDAWVTNMAMQESDFNRLQDVIELAGELPQRVDFSDLVITETANKVYREIYG